MFDLVFAVPGEDEAIRMDFGDIVFVMEDVKYEKYHGGAIAA